MAWLHVHGVSCHVMPLLASQMTHHGLDVMVRRIISDMRILIIDAAGSGAVYNGTRWAAMFAVGTRDLYEGLQTNSQLFVQYSISRMDSIRMLHTILLVATVLLLAAYALLLLRPYKSVVAAEARRLAGLLSHVPAELDVQGHVKHVLRSQVRACAGGMHELDASNVGPRRQDYMYVCVLVIRCAHTYSHVSAASLMHVGSVCTWACMHVGSGTHHIYTCTYLYVLHAGPARRQEQQHSRWQAAWQGVIISIRC